MTDPSWTIAPKALANVDGSVAVLAEAAAEGGRIATEWPFDVAHRARSLRAALLAGNIEGWVAYDGTTVVADLTVFNPREPEPLFGMVVARSHRRRGIGRALIESAVAWARRQGKSALRLRVYPDNEPARALYRNTQFVDVALQTGAVARPDGTTADAILMRRALTDR